MKKLVLTCFLAACAAVSARASIIILAPTASTAGSFQITAPITFTLTADSNSVDNFVLAGLVSSRDAGANSSAFAPALSLSIDGGAPTTYGMGAFFDNLTFNSGDISAQDGFFRGGTPFTAASGSTVTLPAATYTLAATANFNPLDTGTFNGNMFITSSPSGNIRISNIVSAVGTVPEPSTWALLGAGVAGLGVVTLRRRASAAARA